MNGETMVTMTNTQVTRLIDYAVLREKLFIDFHQLSLLFFNNSNSTFGFIGEYIPYKMEDMDWYGYEDEVTGEWICSLVVVYDPALSKMPKQRWHRALDKINKVIS